MAEFTVSGDAEHIYVSDYSGRIVATCPSLDDAERVAEALNRIDEEDNIRPFGRLDPDDPIDQAMVKAFNKGAGGEVSGRE